MQNNHNPQELPWRTIKQHQLPPEGSWCVCITKDSYQFNSSSPYRLLRYGTKEGCSTKGFWLYDLLTPVRDVMAYMIIDFPDFNPLQEHPDGSKINQHPEWLQKVLQH